MDTNTKLYKQDFYRWTREQAALLEARQFDALDMANLVEEITSLGLSQKHALGSHLKNLVMHLLKWHYQPHMREMGHSWQSSIINARDEIASILEDLPSLQHEVMARLTKRYPAARRLAHVETGLSLSTFPTTCPWTPEQVLDPDFWPGEDSDTTGLPGFGA
jgi:Domain of unknown function DUF29